MRVPRRAFPRVVGTRVRNIWRISLVEKRNSSRGLDIMRIRAIIDFIFARDRVALGSVMATPERVAVHA